MAPRYSSLLSPPVAFLRYPGSSHRDHYTDSLAPVVAALSEGATGVTGDVHLTADGDPVLHTEATVRIGLRRRPLTALASSQVPAHITRLSQLYERCGTDLDLAVQVVDEDGVGRVVAVAEEAGGKAAERLWLCASDWRRAASWRVAAGSSRLVEVTRLRRLGEGAERRAASLASAGVDAVRLHESDWNAGLCTLFHRFGRLALAGTVPHQRQLEALLAMGLDGVASDHADRLVGALGAWKL